MRDDITVITADYMYLVIIASSSKLEDIIYELNFGSPRNKKYKYLSIGIDFPCACINHSDIYNLFCNDTSQTPLKLSDKCIKFEEGVESAQTLTFAEGYNKFHNILLEIEETETEILIRFPKLNLDDETEPEKLISTWIKANNIAYIMDKLIIRPVNIVGSYNEILVFAARIPSYD
jgi:hypothetical protein